jgi:shikimate kinase
MSAEGPVERVVLVGFMASGKSTVGQRVARQLGWRFIDFDKEIERRERATVAQIFERRGEAIFRALEAQLTRETARLSGVVLAPGGGWIAQAGLRDQLAPRSLFVWLRVPLETALRRARRSRNKRPLLDDPDPLAKARTLYAAREPLYALSDVIIDAEGRGRDQVAITIAGIVRARQGLTDV